MYNQDLIKWLKWWADERTEIALNMMKSGELADVASTKVMLDECRYQGLIKVTGVTLYDNNMPRYVHYELTDEGKRELGTGTAESTNFTPVTGHNPATCQVCAALGQKNKPATNNTIIVLNQTEEHLLRLIAEKPREYRYDEKDEHAIDGLIGYGFIVESNHDGRLYVLKAGEKWLDEHPEVPPTETEANTEYAAEYYADGHKVFSNEGFLISLYEMSDAIEVAAILKTETARLQAELVAARREVDTMQDRIDDLDHMVDEARKERDVAITERQKTVNQFAQTKRDLQEVGSSYQEIQKTLDTVRDNWRNAEEGLRNQNHDLEMRNAQLATLLRRIKRELASTESFPELHEAIEATLNEPVDDLPF